MNFLEHPEVPRAVTDKLWNANYVKVMLTNFALFFSFYLLTPLLPLYLLETYHSTKDVIGFVLSGYTIMALLVRPFSGMLVDTLPRRKMLLIFLTIYVITFGGYFICGSLILFAVIRTLHGGPFGAVTVASSTLAIDVLPSSRRNEGIGLYGLSNNIATAIAPSVGIFIYRYVHDFDLLFLIAFATAGTGLAAAAAIHPTKPSKPISSPSPRKPLISLDRFFLTRGWFLGANISLFGFCWGVLATYLAIYGQEHLGTTERTGIFFLILSTGLILSRIIGRKSLKAGRFTQNAAEGILLSSIGFTLFIALPSYGAYCTSALLIGLGNGRMWPAFQNMIISISHHNERGTANSTILTAWDIGIGIGVFAGGSVAEYAGFDTAFWSAAAVEIIGFAIYILFTCRHFRTTLAEFKKQGPACKSDN